LNDLQEEHAKLTSSILLLEKTLDSDKLIKKIIIQDQEDFIKAIPKEQREFRTKLSYEKVKSDIEELIEEEDFIITLSNDGIIKKISPDSFNAQGRAGKGRKMTNRDGDFTTRTFNVSSRDTLLCFSNKGIVYKLQTYKIPLTKVENVGSHIANYITFEKEKERIVDVLKFTKDDFNNEDLFIFTGSVLANGKLTNIEEFSFKRGSSMIAAKLLKEEDEVISATIVDGSKVPDDEEDETEDNVFAVITTKNGFTLKCRISDIAITGRVAGGSRLIKLKKENEKIVSLDVIEKPSSFFFISKNGLAKQTESWKFPIKRRYGVGVIGMKLKEKDEVAASFVVETSEVENYDVLVTTKMNKVIRVALSNIANIERPTFGNRLIKLDAKDYVVSATLMNKKLNEDLEEA
jgi:DNA gyrase subunit A